MRPLRRRRLARRTALLRAVTALELATILLIILILTSLSAIGYRRYLDTSVVAVESQKIRKAFATARSWGISQNDYYRVVFSFDDRSYWIDQTDAAGNTVRPKVVTPEPIHQDVAIEELRIGSTSYSSGVRNVRFFPDGRSDEAAVYLVREALLRPPNTPAPTDYYTIRLYGPTARANIFENQRR
ncbi:hypothetical protein JW916_00175 [Candidatus Sumerlaeota bacterium]|nr:hypothetical protein [Candidatus Sumerlaeota bacterium]